MEGPPWREQHHVARFYTDQAIKEDFEVYLTFVEAPRAGAGAIWEKETPGFRRRESREEA